MSRARGAPGQNVIETAIAMAVVVAIVAGLAIGYSIWRDDDEDRRPLTPAEAEFVRSVATQAAVAVSPFPEPVATEVPGESDPGATSAAPAPPDAEATANVEAPATQPAAPAPTLSVVPTARVTATPGNTRTPRATSTPGAPLVGSFTTRGDGSDEVDIPITSDRVNVLVFIDPQTAPEGSWLWCFDSSFDLIPEPKDAPGAGDLARYCSRSGFLDPPSGMFVAIKSIAIDDAWPNSASYVWRITCDDGCSWRLDVLQEDP